MTQFEIALDNNKSAKRILIDYYSSLKFSTIYEQQENQETIRVLAFAPGTFFKDLANQMKVKLSDILEIFKNSIVIRFFSKIGWSFRRLLEILKEGYSAVRRLSESVEKFIEETKISKTSKDFLEKFDSWLKEHQIIRNFTGPVIGALLLFIYFMMSNTGNVSFDFDFSDAIDALRGNFKLADIFGGHEGAKLLTLFVTGVFARISFPWPISNITQFSIGIIATLAKMFRVKLQKASNDEQIISFILKRS